MAPGRKSNTTGGPEEAASDPCSIDARLDAALADSFPASDPPALVLPHGGGRPVETRAGRQAGRRGGPGFVRASGSGRAAG